MVGLGPVCGWVRAGVWLLDTVLEESVEWVRAGVWLLDSVGGECGVCVSCVPVMQQLSLCLSKPVRLQGPPIRRDPETQLSPALTAPSAWQRQH